MRAPQKLAPKSEVTFRPSFSEELELLLILCHLDLALATARPWDHLHRGSDGLDSETLRKSESDVIRDDRRSGSHYSRLCRRNQKKTLHCRDQLVVRL